MKVLVTGGCGFIGHHLVRRLIRDGHAVRVLDNGSSGPHGQLIPGAILQRGDVRAPEECHKAMQGVDLCVHLAAIASVAECTRDWSAATTTNLMGTVNILAAARAAGGVPVVLASSAAVYGAGAPPLSEDAPVDPLSNYGIDKLASEMQARFAGDIGGVPTAILRFFNVYGPGQSPVSGYSGVISLFLEAALAGRDLTIEGDGAQTRDFVFVGDVVDAILAAAPHAAATPPVLNVCRGRAVAINDLARAILSQTGSRADILYRSPRPGDIRHSLGDPHRAKTLVGFSAETDLSTGLDALLKDVLSASA